MAEEFDWKNDESIVAELRHGVAVYLTAMGDVVIRSSDTHTNDEGMDEDDYVIIAAELAKPVAKRILRLMAKGAK